MPEVKRYKRQIAVNPLPNVRRQEQPIPQLQQPGLRPAPGPDAFGAGFGQAMEGVGLQLFEQEQRKQDEIRLLEADNQAGKLENSLMYDPQSGALNVRGQAALGLPDKIGQAWDDGTAKIRQGLGNDRQRRAFDQYSVQKRQTMMDRLSQHVATETYRVDGEAVEGKVENETQAAIADGKPQRIAQAIDSIAVAYQDYGQRYGISPEQTKAATAKAISRIHTGVIDRMLSNTNDIQAKVYFEHVEDQILPDQRGKIESAISEMSRLGQAQRIVDTIKPQYTEDMTQLEMEDLIPKYTQDPEIRQGAEQMLARWFQQKRQDENFRQRQASEQAQQKLEAAEKGLKNTMDRANKKLAFEQVIPQNIRDGLSLPAEKALRSYWNDIADDKEPKTDPSTFYRLYLQASSEQTKDAFAKEDLRKYINVLSRGDFVKLTELQGSIIKGNDKAVDKQLDDFRQAKEMIDDSLKAMGLDPKKNEPAAARVHQLVGERVDLLQRNTGKRASHQDIQEITDDVITKSYTKKGWIWDEEKPLVSITIDDVPKKDRQQIESVLRDNHRVVTDDAIIDLYIRHQEMVRQK